MGGGVGHEQSYHGFAVGPPQLHVPLQLHRGLPVHVQEIEETPVLRVPAAGEGGLDEGVDGQGLQGPVLLLQGLLQQEPARLDGVTCKYASEVDGQGLTCCFRSFCSRN